MRNRGEILVTDARVVRLRVRQEQKERGPSAAEVLKEHQIGRKPHEGVGIKVQDENRTCRDGSRLEASQFET
jgi:hypothetical protein